VTIAVAIAAPAETIDQWEERLPSLRGTGQSDMNPNIVLFVDSLPRTFSNKINYQALIQMFQTATTKQAI